MKPKFWIFLISLLIFHKSNSQRVLREYYDYFKTKLQEERQVDASGQNHGYYKSYYRIGGYKNTGFYTHGTKTGLWTLYNEGATKPYWQDKLDQNGKRIMTKKWFWDGPDAGKLKEWEEWSTNEYDNSPGMHSGVPLLLKHVVYSNFRYEWENVKYYMELDYDIRRTLPNEKRYYREYYPNGKIEYQWIIKKSNSAAEVYIKIETWYDMGGALTKKIIRNEYDEIISTNGVSPADERDTYIVNKKTYLFSDMDMIKDTLISIKEGTLLTINDNDQLSPYYGNRLTYTFRVTYQGRTGYVDKNKLSFVSDNKSLNPILPVETDKYMVDETTYLFREPDLFSDTLIEVEKGTVLTTKNIESKDFKKVTHKGITGYIYSLALSPQSK